MAGTKERGQTTRRVAQDLNLTYSLTENCFTKIGSLRVVLEGEWSKWNIKLPAMAVGHLVMHDWHHTVGMSTGEVTTVFRSYCFPCHTN